MSILRKSWAFALDIFFPPLCLNCQNYLEENEKPDLVCRECLEKIELNKILFHPNNISGINFSLAAAASYNDKTVKELIHHLKYNGLTGATKPLGEFILKYLTDINLNRADWILVPIPLHSSKYRKRGFNQAELIIEEVNKKLRLQIITKALKRVRETDPQITFSGTKREENVKNCFGPGEEINLVRDKKVILVDDVYTSGATMKEAIKVLRRNGVKEVMGLVVAKA
ncbi:MAG: ComF family protein [Patescibacteria group bacterium]